MKLHVEDNFEFFLLDNGIKCYLVKKSEVNSININVKIDVGSRDESDLENGLSHILEHLLFDGTTDFRTKYDVDEFISTIAGNVNAYTSTSKTVYTGKFPKQYLAESLYILSQMTLHPLLLEEDFLKEKSIILDEAKMYFDSIEYKIEMNIIQNRYNDKTTSYSRDVIGTLRNINNFSIESVREWYYKFYVPKNMSLLIIGNIEIKECKEAIDKYFGAVDEKNKSEPVNLELRNRNYILKSPEYSNFGIYTECKKGIDQIYLNITFPSTDITHSDFFEREIAFDILTDCIAYYKYIKSVLYDILREKMGLVYDISFFNRDDFAANFAEIATSFDPIYLEKVLVNIYKAIEDFKNGKYSDYVFRQVIKYRIDIFEMYFDNELNYINWYERELFSLSIGQDFTTPQKAYELIKKIRFEDILALAKKWLVWDKANIAAISSQKPLNLKSDILKIWSNI